MDWKIFIEIGMITKTDLGTSAMKHWLGNDKISQISAQGHHELRG